MKRITLTLAVLSTFFAISKISAQERDDLGHRVGPWNISNHGCFKSLSWKLRKNYYSDNNDSYINEIEIKNNYTSTITFSYVFSDNPNEKAARERKTLAPGETYTNKWCQNINLVNFYVTDVCFNSNNRCDNTCYALCDNGTPNVPSGCAEKNQASGSQPATNQNDLTAYNRSKAEMEQKLQEENNRRQQQANQRESYANAIDAGIKANNEGNYSEAKRQFSTAVSNSYNEDARQKAQDYYNKAASAEEKSLGNTAIQYGVNNASDLAKGIKEYQQSRDSLKEERAREVERQNNISNSLQSINKVEDVSEFNRYADYVSEGLENLNYHFDSIVDFMYIGPNLKTVVYRFNDVTVTQSFSYGLVKSNLPSMVRAFHFQFDNPENAKKFIKSKFYKNIPGSKTENTGFVSTVYADINLNQSTEIRGIAALNGLRLSLQSNSLGKKINGYSEKKQLLASAYSDTNEKDLFELAKMYFLGTGFKSDINKSIGYLNKLIENNYNQYYGVLATVHYAKYIRNRESYLKVGSTGYANIKNQIQALELGIKNGDCNSFLGMGDIKYYGSADSAIKKDIGQAIVLYEKAAELNNSIACKKLINIYTFGQIVPADGAKAKYYKDKYQAIINGNSDCYIGFTNE